MLCNRLLWVSMPSTFQRPSPRIFNGAVSDWDQVRALALVSVFWHTNSILRSKWEMDELQARDVQRETIEYHSNIIR